MEGNACIEVIIVIWYYSNINILLTLMGRNTALIEYVAYPKYYSRTIILKHKDKK